MGRTAMVITDEMVDELEDILTSAGIEVEKEMNSDININLNRPPFSLHCKNKLGERVDLGFRRCDTPPYELVITLFTVYESFFKSFRKTELRSHIVSLLLEHGAKDFTWPDTDESGTIK